MALSAGCRVLVPDVEASEAFDAFRWSGIRAVQSTPLLTRSGRLLGMISTHWRTPHRPTERERDAEVFKVAANLSANPAK
jgi:hypothetical protein